MKIRPAGADWFRRGLIRPRTGTGFGRCESDNEHSVSFSGGIYCNVDQALASEYGIFSKKLISYLVSEISCGYGEELSGSINAGNFLTSGKVYWLASQEGLCSIE